MANLEILPPALFAETLSINQRILLSDLRLFRYRKIVWDLDDTLEDTQTPVKDLYSKALKRNYRDRIIGEFDALSRWAEADGITTFAIAKALEAQLWTSVIVLAKGKPFVEMQDYSRRAKDKGIEQYIGTSRTGRLRQITLAWSAVNYSWIPAENIKITANSGIRYDPEFKIATIVELDPDMVVDNDPDHIGRALNATKRTRFVWLAGGQDLRQLQSERVLALPGGPQQFGNLMSHNLLTHLPPAC